MSFFDDLMSKADDYLEGTYNPKEEIHKTVVKGTTTVLLVASLLTGLAFSGPAEINEDQVSSQLRQAPIVMDVDDYMNTSVDDDDDADEQKNAKSALFKSSSRQFLICLLRSDFLLLPLSGP